MTKSVKATIAVLLLLCVIIAAFPLLSIKDSEFGGADGLRKKQSSPLIQIISHGQKVFWNHLVVKPRACCSVCRQHLVPVSSVLDSAIWLHAKNIKKTK